MRRAERLPPTGVPVNRGRSGGRFQQPPQPNELLIELEASGLRLSQPDRFRPQPVYLTTLSSELSRTMRDGR